MALIDLKTNLKDLKYGHDRSGGGSSKQPFVQTSIPAVQDQLTPALESGGPDFLIRGGLLLPKSIFNDEKRLGKFFLSTSGLLFIVKQNLLSRVAVRTQVSTGLLNEGIYTPISTLLEAAGNPIGLHVNKQGLNPFGDNFYANTIGNEIQEDTTNQTNNTNISTNRLVSLYDLAIVNDNAKNNFGFIKGTSLNDGNNVLSYQGGPDSFLGIGKTHIRYATDNVGAPLKTRNTPTQQQSIIGYKVLNSKQINDLSKEIDDFRYPLTPVDFRDKLRKDINGKDITESTIISNAPSYNYGKRKTIEQRVNLGDPGGYFSKNLTSYANGYDKSGAAGPDTYDKINASILYKSETAQTEGYEDLVNFRIGVIDNDQPSQKTYIHFRAFLNQISDTYNADWNSTQYIGRGEKFYNYTGFDRKVSLSWTVVAQSKIELIPMYTRLNYLASIITPDYSKNGYMRGNIVTLTVGGYFYEQPGIITGLSYEMNDDNSSWEIAINDKGDEDKTVKQLPHMIKVNSFNFIPIHEFVPRKQINTFNNDGTITYGQERYIALLNARGVSNYEKENPETDATDTVNPPPEYFTTG